MCLLISLCPCCLSLDNQRELVRIHVISKPAFHRRCCFISVRQVITANEPSLSINVGLIDFKPRPLSTVGREKSAINKYFNRAARLEANNIAHLLLKWNFAKSTKAKLTMECAKHNFSINRGKKETLKMKFLNQLNCCCRSSAFLRVSPFCFTVSAFFPFLMHMHINS